MDMIRVSLKKKMASLFKEQNVHELHFLLFGKQKAG